MTAEEEWCAIGCEFIIRLLRIFGAPDIGSEAVLIAANKTAGVYQVAVTRLPDDTRCPEGMPPARGTA
ncbi:MAG TPA: hypothetical protein VMU87_01410 [Stellaceae bacterium]|nr:hypothetical protein [Stellaceae bacterium]